MALDRPAQIQEGVIGERVRVRAAFENGADELLYVATTRRPLPGTLPLPVEWDIQLRAAFFTGSPLEDIDSIEGIAGRGLKHHEISYCGLVPGGGATSSPNADTAM